MVFFSLVYWKYCVTCTQTWKQLSVLISSKWKSRYVVHLYSLKIRSSDFMCSGSKKTPSISTFLSNNRSSWIITSKNTSVDTWRWRDLLYVSLCPTNKQMKPHLWSLWLEHRKWPASLVTSRMEKPGGLAVGRRLQLTAEVCCSYQRIGWARRRGQHLFSDGNRAEPEQKCKWRGRGQRNRQMEKLSKVLLPEMVAGGLAVCCAVRFCDGCMDGKMQLRTFRKEKRVPRGRSHLLWSWAGLSE